jgi:hypothetical protein
MVLLVGVILPVWDQIYLLNSKHSSSETEGENYWNEADQTVQNQCLHLEGNSKLLLAQ